MPSFDIVKSWVPEETFRTAAVKASFTLEDVNLQKRFAGELPIEGLDWKIGLIVGRSGTGKTSIAKEKFPDAYIRSFEYAHKNLADFPKENTVDEITTALCNVGFASPPDWLKSYDCLSQGEKMRVDIARALCTKMPINPITGKELIVFDGFTSVVDREIAKIASFAILSIGSAWILTNYGYNFGDAIVESVSALTTTGDSPIVLTPAFPLIPKLMLMMLMLLGRIEILPLFVAFIKGDAMKEDLSKF